MKKILFLLLIAASQISNAQSDAQAVDILNKFITACGGTEKLAAVKSMIRKMESSTPFGSGENETLYKNGKFYAKTTMGGNVVMEQKYDGNRAYVNGMQGSQTIDDEKQLKQYSSQGKPFPLLDFEKSGATYKLAGTEKIDGKDCNKIVATDKDGESSNLFFDASTNLLARMSQKRDFQGQEVESIFDFGDYKAVEGILFAHMMKLNLGQFAIDMKLIEVKINPEIADKTFLIE